MWDAQSAFWSTWVPRLTRDAWILFGAVGVRSFSFGFLSVILGLYLARQRLPAETIGLIFAAALAGGALMTLVLSAVADRLGRRRVLAIAAGLMALAGAAFALSADPILLIAAALVGTINPAGYDLGPFLSIEQAILSQETPPEQRTSVFADYNLVGWVAGALGALAVGAPALLGFAALAGNRLLAWCYVASALVLLALYSRLSPATEVRAEVSAGPRHWLGIHRSLGIVLKLAPLFALDAFAGAFLLQSLVALWFHLRFAAETGTLGLLFFGINALAGLSFLAAAPLARRVGLLNTVVFSHLISDVLLLLVVVMPTLELAAAMLLLRGLFSELDVPTRESYTMAIVAPEERSAVAGDLSVSRNGAAAISPFFTGVVLAAPALGLPFLVAGSLKIVYDLTLYALFHNVRPPEERAQAPTDEKE